MITNGQGNSPSELEELRAELDRVDEGLIGLIATRRDLAVQIGDVKRRNGLESSDPAREALVVRRSAEMARARDLPSEHVRDVFWRLIALSHRAVEDRRPAQAGE